MKEKKILNEVSHMEILDFLEKSGEIGFGKKYYAEHCSAYLKFCTRGIDCHGLSHGAAVLLLLMYFDENPDKKRIEVISGKGLHSTLNAMRDYIVSSVKTHHPDIDIKVHNNSGVFDLIMTS